MARDLYFRGASTSPTTVNVRVDEHRAPTAETARLLKELQEEAHRSIIATLQTPENTLAVDGAFVSLPWTRQTEVAIRFQLNGRPYTVNVKLDDRSSPREKAEKVLRAVCEEMARRVLEPMLKEFVRAIGP